MNKKKPAWYTSVAAVITRIWFPVLLVTLWWLVARLLDNVFLPGPSEIFLAFVKWASGSLLTDLAASLGVVTLGYLLAVAVGVPLGVLIGLYAPMRWFVAPVISIFRGLPPPALLSIFILALGFSVSMRVSIIAWTVVWPVLLHTIDGISRVDRAYLDTASAFTLRPWRRLRTVILPAASSYILAGMKIGLGLAMIMIVVSEMISAESGLGHFILSSANSFNFAAGWAGALVMGIVGYLVSNCFFFFERRILFWQDRVPKKPLLRVQFNPRKEVTR